MKSLLLLLLLFILHCDCSEFQGGVVTYYHQKTLQNGSVEMEIRHKTIFKSCTAAHFSCPSEGCVTLSYTDKLIDNVTGNFCQMESVWTLRALSNAPFVLSIGGYQWTSPTVNEVVNVSFSALVDPRNRSDTGRPNISPQTTVPPIIRYKAPATMTKPTSTPITAAEKDVLSKELHFAVTFSDIPTVDFITATESEKKYDWTRSGKSILNRAKPLPSNKVHKQDVHVENTQDFVEKVKHPHLDVDDTI
ncbi:hypothetical protein WMY93_015135 [Mugilogobius chulae]|uniref:Vitellogenin n=1 Tax=Mugilogobius chulae TaxID=88201 RepID=A0AAW0P697_9GOBI